VKLVVEILVYAVTIGTVVVVLGMFIWAARKDGEVDR
jgi:hypothetical protein